MAPPIPMHSTVVGYMDKKPATAGDFYMMAPNFLAVGSDSTSLADITVSGYAAYDPTEGTGGSDAAIQIIELKGNGGSATIKEGSEDLPKCYSWYDYGVDMPAGWYDDQGRMLANDESPLGNAEDIVFNPGSGFRVIRKEDDSYVNAKLVFNGEVKNTDTYYFPEIAGDFYAAGNSSAASVTLAELTVSGYDKYNPSEGTGGSDASLQIVELKDNGGAATIKEGTEDLPKWYSWYDYGDDMPAGWYDDQGRMLADDQSPLGNADEITFASGDGFRVIRNDAKVYENVKLKIPCPACFAE